MLNSASFAGVSCWWEFNDTQNPAKSTLETGSSVSINNVVKVGTVAYGMQEAIDYYYSGDGRAVSSYGSFWLHQPNYVYHNSSRGWTRGSNVTGSAALSRAPHSYGYSLITTSDTHYAHHYCVTDGGSSGPVAAVNYIIKAK